MINNYVLTFAAGRCIVIGEVGLAHEGSLGIAHRFIDVVADSGADAVKFQTHIAEAEGTSAEQFRVHFSMQDATRADYWRRTAFTAPQWSNLPSMRVSEICYSYPLRSRSRRPIC